MERGGERAGWGWGRTDRKKGGGGEGVRLSDRGRETTHRR